jgi:regulator of protease activity HflC (stomatin/prohibitin superfamily)
MRVKWRRFWLALLIGGPFTAIGFLLGWWWTATLLMLLTLALLCSALPSKAYPLVWTAYAAFAIAWVSGSWIDGALGAAEGTVDVGAGMVSPWRLIWPAAAGLGIGALVTVVFWALVLFASAEWVLAVSDSFGVSRRDALRFVAYQVFQASRNHLVVENGEIAVEKPGGVFARLGGPGVLVVRPGNAVVLEKAGVTTRIVGPGTHKLERFETIKRPHEAKGIVDLRPQGASAEVTGVMTRDGVPLTISVGVGFQIEPQSITDARPESHFAGGDAETPVLGAPEYPVRKAVVRKAVFATGAGGWKGMFPSRPVGVLRDVVGTYALAEIMPPRAQASTQSQTQNSAQADHDPDQRVIRRIEEAVKERLDLKGAGVLFRGMDIRSVQAPDEVRALWHKVDEADAQREALLKLSEARVQSLTDLEKARLGARIDMARLLDGLADKLAGIEPETVAQSLIQMIRELINRVGEDEAVAMRYVQALEALVQSPGDKSIHIAPPPAPGQPGPTGSEF